MATEFIPFSTKFYKEVYIFASDQRAIVTGIRPIDMLPNDTSKYYHYTGSLTTPPCYESVSWYIMHEGIKITQDQVRNFEHTNLTMNLQLLKTKSSGSIFFQQFSRNLIITDEKASPSERTCR